MVFVLKMLPTLNIFSENCFLLSTILDSSIAMMIVGKAKKIAIFRKLTPKKS